MSDTSSWQVLISSDGRVASTSGPPSWVGEEFAALAVSDEAHAVARRLLAQLQTEATRSLAQGEAPASGAHPRLDLWVTRCVVIQRLDVPLVPLIERSLASLQRQAQSIDVALVVDCSGQTPRLRVDPEKIGWAVAQLVGNALRYIRRGTRLIPGGTIRVHIEPDAGRGQVQIVVEDDGPGIPPERQRWLFHREPGAASALALGLSLVRTIVEAHGGSLLLDSRVGPNHGTRIVVQLPSNDP